MRSVAVGARFFCVALTAAAVGGCKPRKPQPAATGADRVDRIVARVGERTFTVADLRDEMKGHPILAGSRIEGVDRRKDVLENVIRAELLFQEAKKRGLDKSATVQRIYKQQMIAALQEQVWGATRSEAIAEADVERYYREHIAEFVRPEQVRVSHILTKDLQRAEGAIAEWRRKGRTSFTDLVKKFSEDADTKGRAGDLGLIERASTKHPKALVEAALALREIDDISPPIRTDAGYHVLRLTQRHPGHGRSLAEVKSQIQRRLLHDQNRLKFDQLAASLRATAKVSIDDTVLAELPAEPVKRSPVTSSADAGAPASPKR